MSNQILLKRASGSDPSASDLTVGEIAIRTDNGKLFTKKDNGSVAEISGSGGGNNFFINSLSSSSATGGGSSTFNGSAYRFELSNPPSVSAQQLLVSINGVVQKPTSGSGQPSQGFAINGNDIILSDAPASGSDFFIVTYASLAIAEPSDNTVTSAKIVDGAIVNADINASAAIAGTKISPDFGSQNIVTTGTLACTDITSSDGTPSIKLNDSANNQFAFIDGNSGNLVLHSDKGGTGSSSTMKFGIDNVIKMTLDSSGNLGIGTTSPNGLLHIEGSSNGTETYGRFSTGSANGDQNLYIQSGSSRDHMALQVKTGNGANDDLSLNPSGGNVGIGTTSPQKLLDVRGEFAISNNNASYWDFDRNDSDGSLQIKDTGTERMRIDSSGNIHKGSSGSSFDANGDDFTITNSSHGGITIITGTSSDGVLRFGDGMSGTAQYQGFINYKHADNAFVFGTSATERMRIDSSGNVGIGITPDSHGGTVKSLQIGSVTNLYNETSDDYTILGNNVYFDGTNNKYIKTQESSRLLQNAGEFTFQQAVSGSADANITYTTPFIIDSSGRVGIGTSSPQRLLHQHLSSSSANYHQFTNSTTGSGGGDGGIVGIDANEDLIVWNQEGQNVRFGTSNTERMRINSAGNVGIGGTAPNYQLHCTTSIGVGAHGFAQQLSITNNKIQSLVLGTGYTDMSINALGGNVGIGKTSSSLDLDGSIFMTSGQNLQIVKSGSGGKIITLNRRTNVGLSMEFFRGSGSSVGSISHNNSSTAFNTTSDYRLKENVVTLSDAITRLKTLKPYRFNFIADKDITVDGFLAHEVTAVPEAIQGEKDAVITQEMVDNEEYEKERLGEILPQGIDQSKLVPLLVAAVQELTAKVEALEAG